MKILHFKYNCIRLNTFINSYIPLSFIYILTLFFFTDYIYGQSRFTLPSGKKSEIIKFKLAGNLIVLPVTINGAKLSFILDSGVNYPIMFNLTKNDSLEINNLSKITLKGLGVDLPVDAYRSTGNNFKIGNIESRNQHLYVVIDEKINFSPKLGFPVHGVIGYEFFSDFIVDVNYAKQKMKIYRPNIYKHPKCIKCETFNLQLVNNKPFINTSVALDGKEISNLKLLIDSGSSDALWLISNEKKNLKIPEKNFEDFLGFGISGSVYGKRARADRFSLGSHILNDVKVAFPDSTSLQYIYNKNERDGSIGGEILKRFRVIFDYSGNKITLKRNAYFKKPFRFNMSGIQLEYNGSRIVRELETNNNVVQTDDKDTFGKVKILTGDRYRFSFRPAYEIVEIRNGSPAALTGLLNNDVVLAVNGKSVDEYSLEEVIEMIDRKPGKTIRIKVIRGLQELLFVFTLKEVL